MRVSRDGLAERGAQSRSGVAVLLAGAALVWLCTPIALAQAGRVFALRGEVKDQNGEVIVAARVSLTDERKVTRKTSSDQRGSFRLDNLSTGTYLLHIAAAGFGDYQMAIPVGDGTPPGSLTVTLYPTISETVDVVEKNGSVGLESPLAAGAKVLDATQIQALPDDPDQLLEQLQILAASSGSAPGGATVTVDGFLTDGRAVPKSSIREVRINPDLFSAEYDKAPYQGGRIEIFTKPGAETFHGSGFFNFNTAVFNARNAFAPTRAPSSTRQFGFQFGGPLLPKRVGFLLDFEQRQINDLAIVNALVLDANFQPARLAASLRTPKHLGIGAARVDWQPNQHNTLSARYDYNANRLANQGIGGFNLADRAFGTDLTEQSLRFSATSVLSGSMFNEARLGITVQQLTQQAAFNTPAIIVVGSFSQGGAAVQSLQHSERRIELADNLSIVAGKHNLKFGVQLFGQQLRDQRMENPGGTFIFGGIVAPQLDAADHLLPAAAGALPTNISGLEQYRRTLLNLPGGTPTRFSITLGNPALAVNQWLFAGFTQDEWRVRPNLTLSFGLRYEGQTSPADKLSLAPRVGVAYAPDKNQRWVVRARAGLFYERVASILTLETQRFDGIRQQQLIVDLPSFPTVFGGGATPRTVPLVRQFAQALQPPATLQTQIGFERQLAHGWKLELTHYYTRGWGLLRSRNINAPLVGAEVGAAGNLDPLLAPRPTGINENLLQFESNGKIRGNVLYVGANQAGNKYFRLYSGYLLFDFHSDTDSPFTLPQTSYSFDGEWARPIWQSRQRAFLGGTVNLPWQLQASPTVNLATGTPFNITTGRDNNGDGNFNDRPSLVEPGLPGAIVTTFGAFDSTHINGTLRRNAGTNKATATLDLNLSRSFTLGEKKAASKTPFQLTCNVRASNLFNHTNLLGFNGVVTSPFFGRANAATPARQLVFGVRLSF